MGNHFFSMLTVAVLGVHFLSFNHAYAAHDAKYPGYDFEPVIIYQSEEVSSQAVPTEESQPSAEIAADDKYPGAYFQPTVIYRDPSLIK